MGVNNPEHADGTVTQRKSSAVRYLVYFTL